MDISTVLFIIFILAVVAALFLLHRSEAKTKNKHKMTAYNLLEEKNPDPKKIRETIKLLRLYGGRFRRDQEFQQLIKLLVDLLYEVETTGTISDSAVKK